MRPFRTLNHELVGRAVGPVAGLVVFLSYFLTLGRLENDHFVIIARARQVLFGEWPARDFIDPGMPLTYLPSAAAAAVAGPTLLTEAVLSIGLVALAAALAVSIARQTSGSIPLALAAAAVIAAFPPRLYSATKVATICLALWLGTQYARQPTTRRLLVFGAWTGVAFLVRFDYAVYIGGAALVLFALAGEPPRRLTAAAAYLAIALLMVGPWLVYVQFAQGLPEYISSAVRFAEAERARTAGGLPWFDWPIAQASNTAPALFYGFLSVPAAGLVVAARMRPSVARLELAFLAVLTLLCDVAFLRDAVRDRIGDAIPQTTVVAALLVSRLMPQRTVTPAGVGATALALAFGLRLFMQQGGSLWPEDAVRQWNDMAGRLRRDDPGLVSGPLIVDLAAYIKRCTLPHERVIVSGFAPEIPILAGRPFAGGLPSWLLGYYVLPADARIIERHLSREEVGAVVLLEGPRVFVLSWPSVASRLRESGFAEYAFPPQAPEVRLWLRPIEAPHAVDAATGLPCRPA
jgi:hypothetical protein